MLSAKSYEHQLKLLEFIEEKLDSIFETHDREADCQLAREEICDTVDVLASE